MQMNTADAIGLFGDGIDSVKVELADGADMATVQGARGASTQVPTAEVVDHATVLAETTDDFTQEINVVGNILLGFGFVALFVSIFIIYNTFSIVLGQRTRAGAAAHDRRDPKQIRRSVIGESLVMGAPASAAGIGGVYDRQGDRRVVRPDRRRLSEWPLILAPR